MSQRVVDRLAYAAELSRGKRVLDVGGCGMVIPAPDPGALGRALFALHFWAERLAHGGRKESAPFRTALSTLSEEASERRVADYQDDPQVRYRIDLNAREGMEQLRVAIDDFRPEVILCMETLEHVNYHFEAMNEFARAIDRYGSVVFITLPNNSNWVLNALGWNHDHSIAFFRDIANRFVRRSDLGKHAIESFGCVQKYVWHWRLAYLLAFGQPFNWGFTVRRKS